MRVRYDTGGDSGYSSLLIVVWSLHFQLPCCVFSGSSMLDQDRTNLQMQLVIWSVIATEV